MISALEARGLLDRQVEYLPGPEALAERQLRGAPLTRAEIGVLLAYAKLTLFSDLVESGVPDEPHFDRDLTGYFPAKMVKKYTGEIHGHRLRREIIATELANDAVNRGGPSFVSRLQDMTGCTPGEIVSAYAVVRDGFELPAIYAQVDALDNEVSGEVQLSFYRQIGRLVQSGTAWQLRNGADGAIAERVAALRAARKVLEPALPGLFPAFMQERFAQMTAEAEGAGAPAALARRLTALRLAEIIPDIAALAGQAGAALDKAAAAFLAVTEAFRIGRIEDAARQIQPADYYEGLALGRANDMIGAARRGIAAAALKDGGGARDPVGAWIGAGGDRVARTRERLQALTEGGDITVARLTVASGLMADLAGL
jgi:glutamate dehydrogenase